MVQIFFLSEEYVMKFFS